jgi:hypothetical protein
MPDTTPHDLGRNDPCHCGSGKKYKRCCLGKDEEAEREARAEAQAEAQAETAAKAAAASPEGRFEEPVKGQSKEQPAPDDQKPHRPTDQPWNRTAQKHQPFQKFRTPRKRGGG